MCNKRQDIQGLRGWAIAMVVAYHFFPEYFPNGYVGVDIFFVISGFLIAMVLLRIEQLNLAAIGIFYYRRIKRILPLYYMVLICILVTIIFYLPPIYSAINADSSWRAIVLISNIKKKAVDRDYKNMMLSADDLFTHTWSLSVEMQWYLFVPLIFFTQRIRTTRQKTFLIGVASCSVTFYFYADDMTSFYSVFSRMWQFICGVIAYMAEEKTTISNELSDDSKSDQREKTENGGTVLSLISSFIFSLIVILSFAWHPFPEDLLRVAVTCLSAVLLYIGSLHQLLFLSHYVAAYVGNISYALYLFHWPLYVVFKNVSCQPLLALSMGMIISVITACVIHHFFECYYLKWSMHVIVWVIIVLWMTSAALIFRLLKYDGHLKIFIDGYVNYSQINPYNAAWNSHLTHSINLHAISGDDNMELTFCTYSTRFIGEIAQPYGFCTREVNELWQCLGLKRFFSSEKGDSGCEFMVKTQRKQCLRPDFDYTLVLRELKPDIVFVLSRVFAAKKRIDIGKRIFKDKIFKEYMKRMFQLEKIAKKVYLLQALPSCVRCSLEHYLSFTKDGRLLRDIKENLIDRDEFFGRLRIAEVGRRCKKCEIIDYMPVLVDEKGHYLGYDPESNLMFFDIFNHFTSVGKDRIQIVYRQLAEEFRD